MISEIIIIFILILINGFLSASEIAIVSSNRSLLSSKPNKAKKSYNLLLDLKDHPNQFLSTVQIGITLIGILIGIFSSGELTQSLSSVLAKSAFLAPFSWHMSVIIVVLCITYLNLILGELLPKRIGLSIPERYALMVAKPIQVLSKIFKPFVWILDKSTSGVLSLIGIKSSKRDITEEEIKALMDEGVSSGVIEDYEYDMMDRLLYLGDKRAINLMKHRSDVDALDVEMDLEEIENYVLENDHTEFPVYQDTFDNIIGVVKTKTLLSKIVKREPLNLKKLCLWAPFVNENASIYQALDEIKESKVQLGVVVDEYGTPQGIVTLKDIVSNLMGPVTGEEKDNQSPRIIPREDGSLIVDGRYQLVDFFMELKMPLTEEQEFQFRNTTTLGGLVFALFGRVPKKGEVIEFGILKFEIFHMDLNRIDKVIVSRPAAPSTEE